MAAPGMRIAVAMFAVTFLCSGWLVTGVYKTPCPATVCTRHATPDPPARLPGEQACVKHSYTTDTWTQTVYVESTCAKEVTFKVLIAMRNSPCLRIAPKTGTGPKNPWRSYHWTRFLGWNGIEFGCA